ncbi:MAG TPA: hypothetical protein VGX28_05225 [Frankiaceae bacterium]|nr:hypothetical protein [Frankiaceae bacterium]
MSTFALAGFAVEDTDALGEVVRKAREAGEAKAVRPGVAHLDWTGRSGAGIDVVFENGTVACAKPTFRGEPGARVRAGRWADRREDCEWCVPLWVEVPDGYPAVVEVDDMALVRGWIRDEEYDASLTVFADERVEWDELARRAAIPVGTFGETPHARMMVSGDVLSAERRVNELTGGTFVHARVASLAADYDVLLPPDEPPPAPGDLVRVAGWVVAHVRRPSPKRWWRR